MRCAVAALVVTACTTPPSADGAAWQGVYQALNGSSYLIESCGGADIRVTWLCDCTQPLPLRATVDSDTSATVNAQSVTLNNGTESGVVVTVIGALSLEGSAFSGEVMYANNESMFAGLFTPSTEPTDLCD
jgi:hypothetical protein